MLEKPLTNVHYICLIPQSFFEQAMDIDFTNINYLKEGNEYQQRAYEVLTKLCIFEDLRAYQPLLTGTIPIEIDLPESDLDIICSCSDHTKFTEKLRSLYSSHNHFEIYTGTWNGVVSTVATFHVDEFEIEIFGQDCPSEQQNAYKHMIIEHAILCKKGDEFRKEIIELKKAGMKTEPAFAKLLGLDGNPYEALLNLTLT